MPRLCTVCTHPQRDEIEDALVSHVAPYAEIARGFGIGYEAVYRHRVYHLAPQLAQAGILDAQALADRIHQLEAHVAAVLDNCTDHRTRLLAVGEARRNVDSLLHLYMVHTAERQQAANVIEDPQLPQVPTDVQSTREVMRMLIEAGAGVPPRELEPPRTQPKDEDDPPAPFARAI